MTNTFRLKETGELVIWKAVNELGKGIYVEAVKVGNIDIRVSNGVSSMGHTLTAEEAESLRQWLNTRHEETNNATNAGS